MLRKTCVLLVLLGIGTGLVFSLSLEDDLAISLEEKRIQDLSSKGVTLVFYLNLSNSSDKTYYLSGYNYRFVVNQKEYFRLQTPLEDGLQVEASKKTLLALPVKITYDLLFQAINGIEEESMVSCYMMGEMVFSDQRGKKKGEIPFAFSGELPIFREPVIMPAELGIKALSVGGADLDFKFTVRNENGFALEIERIRFNLRFSGYQVKEGQVLGNKTIASQGEEVFSLPVLLDFFDVGQDLLALLQQAILNCSLEGELEIRSKWGQVILPFDVSHQVGINKIE